MENNIIKEEVIAFSEWMWKNIDEQVMSITSWSYLYDLYKEQNNEKN